MDIKQTNDFGFDLYLVDGSEVVARGRIELPTRGFSGLAPTMKNL